MQAPDACVLWRTQEESPRSATSEWTDDAMAIANLFFLSHLTLMFTIAGGLHVMHIRIHRKNSHGVSPPLGVGEAPLESITPGQTLGGGAKRNGGHRGL